MGSYVHPLFLPRCSMYGIFTYIKASIHGNHQFGRIFFGTVCKHFYSNPSKKTLEDRRLEDSVGGGSMMSLH